MSPYIEYGDHHPVIILNQCKKVLEIKKIVTGSQIKQIQAIFIQEIGDNFLNRRSALSCIIIQFPASRYSD